MTHDVRRAAESLIRHGSYVPECPDAVEWLRREAADVAAAALVGHDAVIAVLADTAWFDPTDETDARARRVAYEVCAP